MNYPIFLGNVLLVAFSSNACLSQDNQSQAFPSISNDEFYGIPITTRIATRFEIYDPHSDADLQTISAMGFDQVILDWPSMLHSSTEAGLDIVLANWWTDETPKKTIDEALTLARQARSDKLVGISVMDEPERNSPETPFEYYVDLYDDLRAKMTGPLADVPLEISYWGPLASWDQRYYEYFSLLYEACDVMRIMPYPDLHEGPLSEVFLMIQRSRRAMRLAEVDRPHVVILQTWVLPPKNQLPTLEELRVMAYQAMVGGATTVSFFEYKPDVWSKTPGFSEGFAELMTDLRGVRQRYSGATLESTLDENGIVKVNATWASGKVHRMKINTNRTSSSGMQPLAIEDSSLNADSVASAAQHGYSNVSCPTARPRPVRKLHKPPRMWARLCRQR